MKHVFSSDYWTLLALCQKEKNCPLFKKRTTPKANCFKCILCGSSTHAKCASSDQSVSLADKYYCFECLGNTLPFSHLSDNDFHLALFEHSHNYSPNWSIDRLNSLKFNPFDGSDEPSPSKACFNDNFCNPDDRIFRGVQEMIDKCGYYVENNFTSLFNERDVEFLLIHFNIRSIR